jgi:hypothetical protein
MKKVQEIDLEDREILILHFYITLKCRKIIRIKYHFL